MRLKHLAFAAMLAGALLFASASLAASPAGDATAGKDVFMKKCKTCHGEDGHGNQGMAKLLKVTIPSLDSADVQSKSDADLKKIITEGTGKMKPVKDVSDTDVDNVIAYVRTFKK
ncbi:MAG TPA: cytochrome c [Candidatus Acidoferrum sp.]|nr:cytochrome c [Candidatus Acidoferrum sp.]